MNKLQKVNERKKTLDKKRSDLEKLKHELMRDEIAAIFEALGINARPELNYLDHHSNGVTVRYKQEVTSYSMIGKDDVKSNAYCFFEVKSRVKNIEILARVIDAESPDLQTFKQFMMTDKE